MTPIVMHHGLLGRGDLRWGPLHFPYFRGIDRSITNRGYPLMISQVHPTASIITRARQLKAAILSRRRSAGWPSEPCVILAHSMGGLDARYMIRHLGMADRVKALVTISTPHRGSTFADWCVLNLGKRLGAIRLFSFLKLDVQGGIDLTTSCCAKFNQTVPDHPDVRYYSVSAAAPWNRMPPFALHAYKTVYDAEGPNDGLVSIRSASWGTHLGTWPANHWMTINHRYTPEFLQATNIKDLWLSILDRLVADGLLDAPLAVERGTALPTISTGSVLEALS